MNRNKKHITILIGMLVLTFVIWLLTLGQSTIDIQMHDTYFVLDTFSLLILVLGPLTFLVFAARALATSFRSIGANVGLIVGLMLMALITYRIIELQKSYLAEMEKFQREGLQDSAEFIVDMKSKIGWTWGVLGLWIVATLGLTWQTVKIRKERQQRR